MVASDALTGRSNTQARSRRKAERFVAAHRRAGHPTHHHLGRSVGEQIYLCSIRRHGTGWFKIARAASTGHISIGNVEKDIITFTEVSDPAEQEAISYAYRLKTIAPDQQEKCGDEGI